MNIENISKTLQVLAVVVGVVISILSYSDAREKEAVARIKEAQNRRIEALAPFYTLRQERYVEISEVAAILADPESYTKDQAVEAMKRFRALYIVELSMVESGEVESNMKAFAAVVSPNLLNFSASQNAAYNLSHALRKSFASYDK